MKCPKCHVTMEKDYDTRTATCPICGKTKSYKSNADKKRGYRYYPENEQSSRSSSSDGSGCGCGLLIAIVVIVIILIALLSAIFGGGLGGILSFVWNIIGSVISFIAKSIWGIITGLFHLIFG